MRLIALWVVLGGPLIAALPAGERVVQVAQLYVGHREAAPNRSPLIDYWNRRLGVPLGSPYCATFVSFCLDSAGVARPRVRAALAIRFNIVGWSRRPDWMRPTELQRGWILVWRRGSTWQGHVGIVYKGTRRGVWTIEANTTPGRSTPQREREGDGVWKRWREWQRNVFSGNAFRIIAVTPVE